MTDVAGKTTYITGGRQRHWVVARKMLAGLGANIVIVDLNRTDAALHDIESAGRSDHRVTRHKLNIADREMVIGTVEMAVGEVGESDILINMAGIAPSNSPKSKATDPNK